MTSSVLDFFLRFCCIVRVEIAVDPTAFGNGGAVQYSGLLVVAERFRRWWASTFIQR